MYYAPNNTSAPPTVKASVINIENFKGADLSGQETAIDIGRSPNCPNMIRSTPGKVRKRMGYQKIGTFDGRINGIKYNAVSGTSQTETNFVHAGTKMYADGEVIAGTWSEAFAAYQNGTQIADTGMNDERSCWVHVYDRTCILDGKAIRLLGQKVHEVSGDMIHYCPKLSDSAYIPTVMISRDPTGGGTAFEEINILSDGWKESFYGKVNVVAYQLSFGELNDTPVQVEILNGGGETWDKKTENVDFTVDRSTGIITFLTAPGVSPVQGSDNIRITAFKDRSEQRSRVDKCTIGYAYDGIGTGVRLFCTGNPDYPNRDFWSALNDPTYFPDVNYSLLSYKDNKIVGYSLIGNTLATHTANGDIYVRVPTADEDGFQQFAVSNIIKGPETIAPRAFAHLAEPLFLTKRGVYALTVSDLTQERYSQRRSYYIDGALLDEPELDEACACIFKDYYILAVNGKLYILDISTKSFQSKEPYATHQYEAFYFTNVPARSIAVIDDELYFGDDNGNVYKFYSDSHSLASYNDNGAPIFSCWQTPELDGNLFYKNKNFKRIAIRLMPYASTGCTVRVRKRGLWSRLFGIDKTARYFDFNTVDFAHFSFSVNRTARANGSKIKVKKVDKASFMFENNELNMPFEIDAVALEFTESGYFKG